MKKLNLLILSFICGISMLNANILNTTTNNLTKNKTEIVNKLSNEVNLLLNSKGYKGNYNKGFKYYKRYLKKYLGKSSDFLKKAQLNTKEKIAEFLAPLMNKDIKKFEQNLKKYGFKVDKKFKKKIKRIVKNKKKIEDIFAFLVGILNGKIPAGC